MEAAARIAAGKAPAWHAEANDGPQRAKKTEPRKTTPPQPTVKRPWDPSPMAAPCGDTSATGTPPTARRAAGAAAAAAAAAAAGPKTTTAYIRIAPCNDPPRRNRNKKRPKPKSTHPTLDQWIGRALDTGRARDTPETTPGQDDDPDLIDDIL